MSHSSTHQGSSRFLELDGLRALAVVSVILFHCEISGAWNAGFFGVDIFFTISGFIITASLLKEYRRTDTFGFTSFYFRRLKRLLPPVLALIILAFLVTPAISESAFLKLKADAPAALLYVSNWWQIVEQQSYFDTAPHVLKHLWSLAVEEQFYIVWPPIAYVCVKWFGPKPTGVLAIILALISTAWMCYMYLLNVDGADQNRIYLGSDTHAMGLLAGAALACFWNPWKPEQGSPAERRSWRVLGLLSLAILGYMIQEMNESTPALYLGSFLLVPVLTCIVTYTTMNDPRFFVSRLLRKGIIQWIGLRSYSLYLVHWLIFVWMRLLEPADFLPVWTVWLAEFSAVVLLAELMYRCIEKPFIEFNPKHLGATPMGLSIAAYTAFAAVVFSVSTVALRDNKAAAVLVAAAPVVAPDAVPDAVPAAVPAEVPAPPEVAGETESLPDNLIDSGEKIAGGEDIYAIGDSVLLGASHYLSKTIPGIRIDAAVGRQASQGLKVVKEWHSKPSKASTVLVHLGTNGYINEGQFESLLRELADRKQVIVINVHAERRWTAPNNEIIERIARGFPNVQLINWNAVSARRPEYFVKDGIHLTRKGILALTAEIKLATGGVVIPPGTRTDTMLAAAAHAHPAARKVAVAAETSRPAPEAAIAPADAAPAAASQGEDGKVIEAAVQPSATLVKAPHIE